MLNGFFADSSAAGPVNGLLGQDPRGVSPGLLAGAVFRPAPDEDFLTKVLGSSDPRDPRGPAMQAFALGLMRRNAAAGFEGAGRALAETEDRNLRRVANAMTLERSGLELQQMQEAARRVRAIQEDLARLRPVPGSSQSPGFPMASGTGTYAGVTWPSPGNSTTPPINAEVGGTGDAGTSSANQYRQLMAEADVYARHGDAKTALEFRAAADRFKPKYSTTPQLMRDPRTNQLVQVVLNDEGAWSVLPFGAKPDIQLQELGGHVEAVDKNVIQDGRRWTKSPTQADRIAAGNLEVSRRRLALDENSPTYMQTDSGIVALPKRPSPGAALIGQPVAGPGGQPLSAPLKQIPASANAAISGNLQNLKRAQDALTLIEGGQVGELAGDPNATGWKGYIPNGTLNRLDPEGVATRAAIADLGSLVIHDRSGAAVTAAEFPRLAPFIPQATDDTQTVKTKLRKFVQTYRDEVAAANDIYSQANGYRPNTAAQRALEQSPQTAQRLPANPTAQSLRAGSVYELPNGKRGRWNGQAFEVVQ